MAEGHIRQLAPQDFSDWEPLWQGYLAFYKASLPDETTALTFDRLTSDGEPMGGFLMRDGVGKAIGMVSWIDHRSCWTPGDYCYLQDLFVAPAGRGKGAGRSLIEAVVSAAKGRGCSRVYWLTHETNTDAMLLYDRIAEKSGFIQYRMTW
jgi:GNAT superfamily N-acetyltransferase